MKNAITGICAYLVLTASISFGTISSDLTATTFGFWILGATAPTNGKPNPVPSGTPDEDYIVMGVSDPFYWETSDGFDDEGKVDMWVYDSGVSLDATVSGGSGPYWGLRSTDLGQVMIVGLVPRSYNSGTESYETWSSVSPFAPLSFRDGIRGSHGAAFTAGWYHWAFDGSFDDVTITLYNVMAWACDGTVCRQTPPAVMDVVEVRDANYAGGTIASVFGFGWSGIALRGDAGAAVENFYVQIIAGDRVFKDVGGVLAIEPTQISSWGAIKQLY